MPLAVDSPSVGRDFCHPTVNIEVLIYSPMEADNLRLLYCNMLWVPIYRSLYENDHRHLRVQAM